MYLKISLAVSLYQILNGLNQSQPGWLYAIKRLSACANIELFLLQIAN